MILSIIVPMHNSSKYLAQMFSSLGCFINEDLELILIDDGSLDDTYEKCINFAQNKKNVQVIRNINRGVSYSRNCGLQNASGNYVMFLDSDDVLVEGWFEDIIESIEASKCSDVIVFSNCITKQCPNLKEVIQTIIGYSEERVCDYLGAPWSKIYKRELLLKNKILFDENVIHGEDALFNIEVFINANNYFFVNKPIYLYRVNYLSVTHTYDDKFLDSNERYINILFEVLHKTELFSDSDVCKWVDYSFANSIYIFTGKISKLPTISQRLNIVKEFYNRPYYVERLKLIKYIRELPILKKIVYIFVRYRLLFFLEIMIPLMRRRISKNQEYWIQI